MLRLFRPKEQKKKKKEKKKQMIWIQQEILELGVTLSGTMSEKFEKAYECCQ